MIWNSIAFWLANGWPRILSLLHTIQLLSDMATIKFQLRSKSDPANIYVRLTHDRQINFRRRTGYIINPDNWSSTTNLPKQGDEKLKQLKTDLQSLANRIEENLNNAITKGDEITGDWLQNQIDTLQGKQKKTDLDRLTNYIQNYVDNLKYKEYPNGKRGATRGTFLKYQTIKNRSKILRSIRKNTTI